MTTKDCTMCGITKPFTEFHKNRSMPDGHAKNCKKCRSAGDKGYYYTKMSPEEKMVRKGFFSTVSFDVPTGLLDNFRESVKAMRSTEQETLYRMVRKFTDGCMENQQRG